LRGLCRACCSRQYSCEACVEAVARGGIRERRPRPLAIKASLQSWLGVPISSRTATSGGNTAAPHRSSGKRVSVDQALQLSTVWACVRLISETLATLPLGFYRRNTDGSRTSATSHQLYEVLHSQPNADMTAVVFWEVVVASMLLWGNAYVEIIRSGNTVIALQFLMPARMNVRKLAGGAYEYRYRDTTGSGAERPIAEESLMHIPAFSTDGVFGLSPIAYGANVFGTAIETDQASAETFRDSMRSPGLVTMDMLLKKQQREDIRAHVKDVSERGGVMVLEKGASFQKLGFDPVSAELLSSRSFNVEEICRWYRRRPGHGRARRQGFELGHRPRAEDAVVSHFALRKWCVRIEQAIRKSLLSPG
jgi:HK97 family phage portal protein